MSIVPAQKAENDTSGVQAAENPVALIPQGSFYVPKAGLEPARF